MKIGIIGAGGMGAVLARRLSKLGHQVSIANSRGPESLSAMAVDVGATPVSVLDAAKAGEVVVVAIPTKAVADLPRGLFANVADTVVVIDIGNYHPELRDGRIDAIDRGMLDSQWVAQQIGRPVIKAFNNIFAHSLREKGVPRGTKGRIALPVAGDSLEAKAAVLRLVDDLGFDPVDGGDLDNSWRQQPGTPAYCRDLDAAALRRALAEPDRSRIAEYRAEQEARIKRQSPLGRPGEGENMTIARRATRRVEPLTATSIKTWLGANLRSGMRYENAVIGSPREVESG
jgi:predicted dinucleotide-binding enzyme